MRHAVFLASVQDDLVRILTYIARASGSLSVAQRLVRELREYCHKLAGLPGTMGRARPEIRPDLRSAPYWQQVVTGSYVAGETDSKPAKYCHAAQNHPCDSEQQ